MNLPTVKKPDTRGCAGRSCAAVLVAFLAAVLASGALAQRQMYRYVNDQGNKVLAYQVPPEYVANGYEILSPTGALISVVPRQLGDDEREDLDAQARLDHEAAKEEERLRKWDESLLLRYSTIEDIESARERALRELRIRVGILRSELRSLKQQVENNQAMAADQERIGRKVDPVLLETIDELRSQIAATERAVADREKEIAVVDASYDRDVERFSSLLEIVEMRRNLSSGGGSGED
ncbi:MAG: hypothetical protein V2I82_10600 [Halieaceae bacterium]|nr:hypothetical protein [Halieaceae bacterium]